MDSDELDALREQAGLPALATAFCEEGKAPVVTAVGVRKGGDPTPVTTQDRFHIGSCTKAMTATLIGMLRDEGILTADTPLLDLFPGAARSAHREWARATVGNALAHRAGFASGTWTRGFSNLEAYANRGPLRDQRRRFVDAVFATRPKTPPGTAFEYANAGYIVLGAAIERLWNDGWESRIAQRLWRPLGIVSAGFGAPGTAGKIDQPTGHTWKEDTPVPAEPGLMADNPAVLGPAGTVHLTLADWVRFGLLHLASDRLLRPETFAWLHRAPETSDHMGGWIVVKQLPWTAGPALSHSGSNRYHFATIWVVPGRRAVLLVATNAGPKDATDLAKDPVFLACDRAIQGMIRRFLS